MNLHNFNSNTKSWKIYTNTLTSISGDDLLVVPSYGNNLILGVSGNNEIIFKKGDISYNLNDLIGGGGGSSQNSDYATYNILDITGKIIFTDNSTNVQRFNDASLNNVDIKGSLNVEGTLSAPNIYTKTEIDASLANVYTKTVIDASLANIYTKTEIDASLANIYTKTEIDASLANVYTKTVIDASLANIYTKTEIDASLANIYTKSEVDVSFVSKELFDISFTNVYTKSEVDNSFTNVYTKNQVDLSFVSKQLLDASFTNIYTKLDVLDVSLISIITHLDASFTNVYSKAEIDISFVSKQLLDISLTNVYTKLDVLDSSLANVYTKGEIDVSFVSKELFDASLSSIQVSNVYTKNEVDVSFVSKQLFETSYNVLLSAIGTGGGSGSGGTTTTSSIAKKFYNQDWNLLGQDIIFIKDLSAIAFMQRDSTPDGYTILVECPYSIITATGPIDTPNERRSGIAVFNFNTITNSWVQKGNTILAPRTYTPLWFYTANQNVTAQTGIMGSAIDDSGNRIAFSTTRSRFGPEEGQDLGGYEVNNFVYDYDGTSWIQVGNINYVPTSNDGEHKYTFVNSVLKLWKIIGPHEIVISTFNGTTFITDATPLQIPYSIMQNALPIYGYMYTTIGKNGNTIAIIMKQTFAVFIFNGTSWQQHGSSITDLRLTSDQRYSIKISYDGSRIILPNWDETVNGDVYAGRTTVYGYDNTIADWKIIGQEIVYEEKFEPYDREGLGYGGVFSGHQISGDGNTIVLGTGVDPIRGRWYGGLIQVYKYSSASNYWSKIGREIQGITRERPGQYITLSYDGSVMSIDGEGYVETYVEPWMYDSAFPKGRIRVYEIEVDPSFSYLSSGSSSSADGYSKIEIDASFTNVYTKLDVLDSSLANVYTRGQVDVSFVSKQLFDASINALAVSGGGSSSTPYDNNIKILPDWIPLVEISNNLYTNLGFGSIIAFSKDGYTVATYVDYRTPGVTGNASMVGRIIVYHYNGGSWVQKGQNLDGTDSHMGGGLRTTLSNDGNILAVGFSYVRYIYNENGNWVRGGVQIYKYNLTTFLWEPMGSFIIPIQSTTQYGTVYNELFGDSMSFSNDGTIIAIGAPYSLYYHGAVLIYKYETRNSVLDWYYSAILSFFEFQIDINIFGGTQDGIYIYPNGGLEYQSFGSQVTLSSDGTVVAGSAPYGPSNSLPDIRVEPPAGGIVRIFKFNGTSWVNTGRIVGEYDQDGEWGISISLSGNGDYIAIGTQRNSGNGQWNGHVRVYKWNNSDSSWNQLGLDIDGQGGLNSDGLYARTGNSISLSYDGTILAVSANDQSEYKMGRVYKWDGTAWNRYGNGFNPGSSIFLTNDGNRLASGTSTRASIVIYNLLQNNIVSLNSTNLFCLDGYNYSYKKNDIKTSVYSTSESSVHSEYYSDFPNKFTRTLYILQNGALYNRNNTYGSFSDIRLKENIVDATPKLEDLLKVRVVNYNLIGSSNKYIGVVAQELEEIFPGLVETETSGQKYKSVKYSCMNIMLVKALQEQQVLINDMSSNISTLKDEVATLKQGINSLTARLEALEASAN